MKILAVDDNQTITTMISKFFKLEGDQYEVMVANNGAEALSKYNEFKPDVVLLDIAMPVMDGIETLSRLLKMDDKANIIMASASGSSDRVAECLRKGARGYVEKPFSPEELLVTIKNLTKTGTSKSQIVTAFSLVGNKIQSSLHKIIDSETSFTLKDIEFSPRTYEKQIFYSSANPSNIREAHITETKRINVPEDCLAFTSEVSGQQNGIVVAVINKKQLRELRGEMNEGHMLKEEVDSYLEFFNIINHNIFSQLADFIRIKVDLSQARFYDKDKDSVIKEKDFVKASYEISREGTIIPLDFYLWFDVDALVKR
ncbi:MAG: putative response regulatory domain-containing protein [Marine Group I thaumarchaeote]|nr:MAG: putative response regulatory domain-containing protein [Marine Group I thaumarchaeote]